MCSIGTWLQSDARTKMVAKRGRETEPHRSAISSIEEEWSLEGPSFRRLLTRLAAFCGPFFKYRIDEAGKPSFDLFST